MYFTPLKFGVISKLVHLLTKHAIYIINYKGKLHFLTLNYHFDYI